MFDNNTHNKFEEILKESETESDRTKDTLFPIETSHIFKEVGAQVTKTEEWLLNFLSKLNRICESTSVSDKVVRLVGSILKILKNFSFLKKIGQMDKLISQIGQLRRLLRINRVTAIIKDYITFFKKEKRSIRDWFDFFFKSIMILCDISDLLLYSMQLKIVKSCEETVLRKNVVNLYFIECVLWACQHIYDYINKEHKTEAEVSTRLKNISKYVMDMTVSHNEFSLKQFSVSLKNVTLLSFVSSIVGFNLVWK